MEKEWNRNQDQIIEKEIGKFCDKYMYSDDMHFDRCRDASLQKQGCDGFLTYKSKGILRAITDEKCAAHYVNKELGTYALELSQITMRGDEVDGWFLDEKSKTEYYMLIYLTANVDTWQEINYNNITSVEYYLVRKSDIFSFLKKCGFDKERLHNAVTYLRKNEDLRCVPTDFGFKFVISRKFRECPVNIVIDRSVYEEIAVEHKLIKV